MSKCEIKVVYQTEEPDEIVCYCQNVIKYRHSVIIAKMETHKFVDEVIQELLHVAESWMGWFGSSVHSSGLLGFRIKIAVCAVSVLWANKGCSSWQHLVGWTWHRTNPIANFEQLGCREAHFLLL